MEDGLVLYVNPSKKDNCEGLNPYCNGRWSRTAFPDSLPADFMLVLILIVMEDGLVPPQMVMSAVNASKS